MGEDIKYEVAEDVLARIENNFSYHKPQADQLARYEFIRAGGAYLAAALCERCPQSRELSLALTKIEEAVMWANAAIARNEAAE